MPLGMNFHFARNFLEKKMARSIDTALDLAEAYRHFGHADKARVVLDDQRRFTPDDARLRAPPPAEAAVDCKVDNRPVCRAQRGFDALQAGQLERTQAELAGADFVKTSTGFGPSGATAQDVALMRQVVGPNVGVKASGGIRTLSDLKAMTAAGASRIGASASVKIVEATAA